jgi:hypothetical protein
MSKVTFWTPEECEKLYLMITEEGLSFEEAGEKLGKSKSSCQSKFRRINPDKIKNGHKPHSSPVRWTAAELQRLYDLRTVAGLGWIEIGKLLGRSPVSCERKYQTTDWDQLGQEPPEEAISPEEEREMEQKVCLDKFVEWLTSLARGDYDRLRTFTEEVFVKKVQKASEEAEIDFTAEDLPVPFKELKRLAKAKLERLGLMYPKEVAFKEGTYVIVGDSHGKHTRSGMFDLLRQINKTLKPKKIIHVGHAFDDDDDISYHWKDFSNLLIIGARNELGFLKDQEVEHGIKYDIVNDRVLLGKLAVANQYDISDYVMKFVGNIKPGLFPYNVIVNCHRHEMHSRCTHSAYHLIASPGCLCERHIVQTIKQQVWKDGGPTVRQAMPQGFKVYNRREQFCDFWEQGLIIVQVDKQGDFTIVPCRVFKTSKGFTTSYVGKMISESGVFAPDQKIMVNGDLHAAHHDANVLDIQEQFCKAYKPDVHVNVGDTLDNRALNHHEMAHTGGPIPLDVLREVAHCAFIIERMRSWADDAHILYGNHERFMSDFVTRYPQLASMFNMDFLFDLKGKDISLTPLKKTLDLGGAKFVHGDMRMYGATGSKPEKIAGTFGPNTLMGNFHYPAIRFGCYSVGLTGQLDQEYNEADASQWLHGFAFCNIFEDQAFLSLVNIKSDKCILNGKTFRPKKPSNWDLPDFDACISFRFKGKGKTKNRKK